MRTYVEANAHVHSFERPYGMNIYAWNAIKKMALYVWKTCINGGEWNSKITISCVEQYQMLLDENKQLIVPADLLQVQENEALAAWEAKYLSLATQWLKLGEAQKAINFCKAVLKLYPSNAKAQFIMAQAFMKQQKVNEAIAALNQIVKLNNANATVYFYRAKAYFQAEEYSLALRDSNMAILLNSKFGYAYLLRSKIHAALSNNYAAEADLKRSKFLKGKHLEYNSKQTLVHAA